MAYGIDDYGNDTAPPGYNPPAPMVPQQQNDPERAMRRQRLLYALASGLRTPNQGGGFLGGLASGFSGSVMGAQQFQQQRGEEYRQQQKDEAEQKRQAEQDKRANEMLGFSRNADRRAQLDQEYENQKRAAAPAGPDYHGFIPPDFLGPEAPGTMRFPSNIPYTPKNTEVYGETIARERAQALFPKAEPPDTGGLDPALMDNRTLRMLAQAVRTQGPGAITGMFRGKDASRGIAMVLHEAANPSRVDPNESPVTDLASSAADYKTNVASLQNTKKLYDNSTAFEKTAVRNSKLLLDAIDKLPDYGNEPANSLMRTIGQKSGDPRISAFNVARKVAFTEWARLVGSPGAAGGVITDSQLKELDSLLNGGATKPQMRAAVQQFVQDGLNKRKSYSEQIDQIRRRTSYDPLTGGQNPNENVYGGDVSAGDAGAPAGGVTEEYQRVNGKLVRVR